jgi:hypothetical protein
MFWSFGDKSTNNKQISNWVLFKPLKRSWNLDIENEDLRFKLWPNKWLGIKFTIWYLTIKIEKINKNQMTSKLNMKYNVRKVFSKYITFSMKAFQLKVYIWGVWTQKIARLIIWNNWEFFKFYNFLPLWYNPHY